MSYTEDRSGRVCVVAMNLLFEMFLKVIMYVDEQNQKNKDDSQLQISHQEGMQVTN